MGFKDFDLYFFYLINNTLQSSVGDTLMPLFREMTFWFPLYVFILIRMFVDFKKQSFWFIIGIVIAIGLSDFIASGILKPLFARLRPCNDPVISHTVHLLCGCSGFSFASSHAANHFAIATFIGLIYQKKRWVSIALSMWASLVCIAQIYVGLHYPSDIVAGCLIGITVGMLLFVIIDHVLKKQYQWL